MFYKAILPIMRYPLCMWNRLNSIELAKIIKQITSANKKKTIHGDYSLV